MRAESIQLVMQYLTKNILLTSVVSCYKTLIEVLSRLEKYNFKVNESKCKFFEEYVKFLGHIIERVYTQKKK